MLRFPQILRNGISIKDEPYEKHDFINKICQKYQLLFENNEVCLKIKKREKFAIYNSFVRLISACLVMSSWGVSNEF